MTRLRRKVSAAAPGRASRPTEERIRSVASAVLEHMRRGLPQDPSVLDFLASTHGPDATVGGILESGDEADAATMTDLIISPSRRTLLDLEPVLESARLDPAEALEAASFLERLLLEGVASPERQPPLVWAVFPDGRRAALPLEPGLAGRFLRRLRPEHGAPEALSSLASRRFTPGLTLEIAVSLRHCRLEWTPQRLDFLTGLLAGLEEANVLETLDWTLAWLDTVPPGDHLPAALGRTYDSLSANLRRALDFQDMLARSSFETLSAQGLRAPLLHPGSLRRDLDLLDAVCLAVTGRPAWTLANFGANFGANLGASLGASHGPGQTVGLERDLGAVEDAQALIDLMGRIDQG